MKKETKTNSKRLRITNFQRDGKGLSKSASQLPPSFKRFFISYKNNSGKILSVNIIYILGNFPLLFLICNIAGYFKKAFYHPMSDLFQNISHLFVDEAVTPYEMSLFAMEGLQRQALADTTVNYVFYAIGALTLLTFGIVNVGTAYILRNIASGEPVFTWNDFIYAIKRNYKQAIPFGIIDIVICAVLLLNISTMINGTENFIFSMLFWCNVVIFIVYFFMRYYIYVQMVTFKLSVFKIIKNSLIFALLGFKRNICALLGIIICICLEFFFLFSPGAILISVAVIFPLTIAISSCSYMKVYAAYFKIKEVMIDPYLQEHPEEKPQITDDEPVMKDDVTEMERLEKIKEKNGIKE